MKQFIVDRHTTPNTPTLEQVPTEKIPVYNDMTAAAADLANLAENQIIATHDTGTELSAPVDTVQSGNMHAVTSKAVAGSLSYSTTEQKTGGYWIDGKPIYRKVVDLGALGSESAWSKNVLHGISNISTVVSANALTYQENGIQCEIMPCYQSGNQMLGRIMVTSTIIYLSGYGDWSYYKARVILEYTKTTD